MIVYVEARYSNNNVYDTGLRSRTQIESGNYSRWRGVIIPNKHLHVQRSLNPMNNAFFILNSASITNNKI